MTTVDEWAPYRTAHLGFGDPECFSLSVDRPWTTEDLDQLRSLGLDGPFAVVTAHHPHERRLDAAENDRRHDALLAEVRRLRLHSVPCRGRSPDASHREEGVAIACSLSIAVSIARRFEQSAIYWWDGSSLWIEPVISTRSPERLPRSPR